MNRKTKKALLVGGVIAAAVALFLVLALTGTVKFDRIPGLGGNGEPNGGNSQDPTTEPIETDEEKELREKAFAYVPEDAMLVAQVHTSDMSDKDLDAWWDWYRKMSPHPHSLPTSVSGVEGLKSIVLSYYPSDDEDFSELYMFDYSYVFAFDDTVNRDNALIPFHEKIVPLEEDQGTSAAAMDVPIGDNKAPLIVYAPVSSLSEIEDLESGDRAHADVEKIELVRADAPTLYVDPAAYIAPYTKKSEESGESFVAFGQAIEQSIFGVNDKDEANTWVGVSEDYGKTWVSQNNNPEEEYERFASNISLEGVTTIADELFSDYMSSRLEEAMEDENFPGYYYGGMDLSFEEGLLDSFSVKLPGEQEATGAVTDPYASIDEEGTVAESSNEEEFVMIVAPRRFHGWYASTSLYTQVASVTIRATPEQSTMEFDFDDATIQ